MKKFGGYPIYINYTEKVDSLPKNMQLRFEVIEDRPSPASQKFENDIYKLLTLIASTKVGKYVFDSLNTSKKYWVVPFDLSPVKNIIALTWSYPEEQGGGIRIYFTAGGMRANTGTGDLTLSDDDALFHEFVHAYRFGRVGWCGQVSQDVNPNEYKDAEEFVALQLQNVYLANRGSTRFYLDYISLKSVSKGTAYENISRDPDVIRALRFWSQPSIEPLVYDVAQWSNLAASFNGFRDWPYLEEIYRTKSGFRDKHLPDFMTSYEKRHYLERQANCLKTTDY